MTILLTLLVALVLVKGLTLLDRRPAESVEPAPTSLRPKSIEWVPAVRPSQPPQALVVTLSGVKAAPARARTTQPRTKSFMRGQV